MPAHSPSSVWDIKLINNVTAVTCGRDIKVWNLLTRTVTKSISSANAHSGLDIYAIEVLRENVIVTTGVDKKVKVCCVFLINFFSTEDNLSVHLHTNSTLSHSCD